MKLFKSIVSCGRKLILLPKNLWLRWQFQRIQGARAVPDRSYFVAPNGQVILKFPKLHMSKKRRLAQRLPGKLKEYVDESRAALEWAGKELKRKDAILQEIRVTIMAGKGFPAVMEKLREATT